MTNKPSKCVSGSTWRSFPQFGAIFPGFGAGVPLFGVGVPVLVAVVLLLVPIVPLLVPIVPLLAPIVPLLGDIVPLLGAIVRPLDAVVPFHCRCYFDPLFESNLNCDKFGTVEKRKRTGPLLGRRGRTFAQGATSKFYPTLFRIFRLRMKPFSRTNVSSNWNSSARITKKVSITLTTKSPIITTEKSTCRPFWA